MQMGLLETPENRAWCAKLSSRDDTYAGLLDSGYVMHERDVVTIDGESLQRHC